MSSRLLADTASYHHSYALRRASSTMASAAERWLCARAPSLVNAAWRRARPARVLSVGCGDGSLDMALLRALSALGEVEYVGLEINPESRAAFEAQLCASVGLSPGLLRWRLLDVCAERYEGDAAGFDLVLFSHCLYYLSAPAEEVLRSLHTMTRADGHVVVIHSAKRGIPAVMEAAGLAPFLTAEDICEALAALGGRVQVEIVETSLDATALLEQTPEGIDVLSFCVEQEVGALPRPAQLALQRALWTHAALEGGAATLTEELGFLVLQSDLGARRGSARDQVPPVLVPPVLVPPVLGRIGSDRDPVVDYRWLAEVLRWDERLLPPGDRAPLQILDVGCGTGRWLRALNARYPELRSSRAGRVYSAVDPDQVALQQALGRAEALFCEGQSWPLPLERIRDLPEEHFDLVWAVHSLYNVPVDALEVALARLLASLKPDGVAVLAHPRSGSFYIEAAKAMTPAAPLRSAEQLCAALDAMGVAYAVQRRDFEERIDADDDSALRHYLWRESIENSFSSGGELPEGALRPLPDSAWWRSHRRGGAFVFPQHMWIISVRGGQRGRASRRLAPDLGGLRRMTEIAAKFVLDEHARLDEAPAWRAGGVGGPPSWVHRSEGTPFQQQAAELLAATLAQAPPEWGSGDLAGLLRDTLGPLSQTGTHDNAPGYLGYVPSGGLYLGAVCEWIAASLNRYTSMRLAAPGLAALERLAVKWLVELLGLGEGARSRGQSPGGVLLSGGSMATLQAVHAARVAAGVEGGPLVAYHAETSHSCVARALQVCGLSLSRCVKVDRNFRIHLEELQQAIEEDLAAGHRPFLLVVSAGEVRTGAVDPLAEARALCDRYGMWLHVDAAYGGFFALTHAGRRALAGMELADSICVDPHKGMGLPYGTGALLVSDGGALRRAFSFDASYLPPARDDAVIDPDEMELGVELTRPFRGLRVWLPLQLLGVAPFRAHLERALQDASWLAEQLDAIPAVELVGAPQLSICVFRVNSRRADEDTRALLEHINSDPRFFLTACQLPVSVGGGFAIRVAVLSFRTDRAVLSALLERIRAAV